MGIRGGRTTTFAHVQMRNGRASFECGVRGFDLFVDGDWHGRVVAFLRDRSRNSNGDNARSGHQAPASAFGLGDPPSRCGLHRPWLLLEFSLAAQVLDRLMLNLS